MTFKASHSPVSHSISTLKTLMHAIAALIDRIARSKIKIIFFCRLIGQLTWWLKWFGGSYFNENQKCMSSHQETFFSLIDQFLTISYKNSTNVHQGRSQKFFKGRPEFFWIFSLKTLGNWRIFWLGGRGFVPQIHPWLRAWRAHMWMMLFIMKSTNIFLHFAYGAVHLLCNAIEGKEGLRFCDISNKWNFFKENFLTKGARRVWKVGFLRYVISEWPLSYLFIYVKLFFHSSATRLCC